jgi:membrane protein
VPAVKPVVAFWRFLRATAERFYADKCLLWSTALAYTTLLSLVPLLALMFAVLKGLDVQERLEPILLLKLGMSSDVTAKIMSYIDHTNFRTLGALGGVTLIVTVLSLFGQIENAFNHIWRVRAGRVWYRKLTDYVSVVLLAPLLLVTTVTLTSTMENQKLLHVFLQTEYVGDAVLAALRLAPIVVNVVGIGLLYAVLPNRRPDFGGLALGAVVAGCAWQGIQWAYVAFQVGVARYNAIYGALSQLPLTLVWIYFSWAVVLLGAEVAAVWERGSDGRGGGQEAGPWEIALEMLAAAAEAFGGAGGGIDPRAIARRLGVAVERVEAVGDALAGGGLLAPVEGPRLTWVLARTPAAIDLAGVEALVGPPAPPARGDERVASALRDLRERQRESLRGRTLADVLGPTKEAPP